MSELIRKSPLRRIALAMGAALVVVIGTMPLWYGRPVRPAAHRLPGPRANGDSRPQALQPGESRARSDLLARALQAGASQESLAPLVERAVAADPRVVGRLVEEAWRQGDAHLDVLMDVGTTALVDSGRADLAASLVRQWADSTLSRFLGNAPIETVAGALAQSSREQAEAWLISLPDSPSRSQSIASYAADWAEGSPSQAMAWASNLEDDADRATAMERVYNRWSNANVPEAVGWLSAHADDPSADRIITAFVNDSTALQANPAVAATWAEALSSSPARANLLATVLSSWARKNPQAAANFVATTNFVSPEERQQMARVVGSASAVSAH